MSLISGQPSSQEGSRRNSREEKRLSGISLSSFIPGRSRSEQRRASNSSSVNGERPGSSHSTASWQPVVSPSAPRLPSFRWNSRERPANNEVLETRSGGDLIDGDLVAIPYSMEDSAVNFDSDRLHMPNRRVQGNHVNKTEEYALSARGVTRSATEPALTSPSQQQIHSRGAPQAAPIQQNEQARNPHRSDLRPHSTREEGYKRAGEEATEDLASGDSKPQHGSQFLPASLHSPRLMARSSHDGSSYVHKQRMYQQQRSIAGFEDEQAVQLANEQAVFEDLQRARRAEQPSNISKAITNPNEEPKATIATVTGKSQKQPTPRPLGDAGSRQSASLILPMQHPAEALPSSPTSMSQSPQTSSDEQLKDQQTRALRRAGDPVSPHKQEFSKAEKMLGFHRRSKQPPSEIVIPDVKTQKSAECVPPSTDSSDMQGSSTKLTRIERMSAQIPFKNRHNSPSSQTAIPSGARTNENPRSDSGTRVSSSQVLDGRAVSSLAAPSVAAQSTPVQESVQHRDENSAVSDTQQTSPLKHEFKPSELDRSPSKSERDAAALAASYSTEITTLAERNDQLKKDDVALMRPKDPELVVESITGDGIIRKTSITRPRSNPHLQTTSMADKSLPSLDFLPQLKHQPLVKSSKRNSTQKSSATSVSPVKFHLPTPPSPPSTAYKSPATSKMPDLALMPRSALRSPSNFPTANYNRSLTSVTPSSSGKSAIVEGLDAKPMAKLFVICCKCKFWHDLPSKLYEAMALPKQLHRRDDSEANGTGKNKKAAGPGKAKVAEARLETAVKCPWCEHAMTTWCCAGWTTVVYLHERHH